MVYHLGPPELDAGGPRGVTVRAPFSVLVRPAPRQWSTGTSHSALMRSAQTNLLLGSELSTSTVTVPVTGTSVSTSTLQPSGGRTAVAGNPLAATT